MADNYLVVTKDKGFTIKETVQAQNEFEARNRSQFGDAGMQQSVQRLTAAVNPVKKEPRLLDLGS